MKLTDEELRQRLRLGEDSGWEFKQIEFSGDRPTSPRREDLADEMGAFANASGGVLLCGVSDDGRIQGMSAEQMAALDRLLVRYVWFDRQIVPQTGFETLNERLWEPLLSVAGAADPRRALSNLRLLASDEAGVDRATVAGVLLCTDSPEEWLPQATIMATRYRGKDRASGQLDA